MARSVIMPTVFVPHGAGPCFFMDWDPPDTWRAMGDWLRALPRLVGATPQALLLVSAHWEAPRFAVNGRAHPGLLFDYGGFPPHTYELRWPAPGAPALAERAAQLLAGAGIEIEIEQRRDWDHGVFIPMMLAFPQADVPVLQLSLRAGLDPAEHLAVGRALAPLREEGVLIVGSGMSYHNLRAFFSGSPAVLAASRSFDDWLAETVACPAPEREARLQRWQEAPAALASHPRAEHLLPLHVVAGAAGGDPGAKVFEDVVLGSVQSACLFGAAA
ncbi:MAG: class III extradiol ring-cleavage dioxygenase [Nevskiales bacterium]|nr:class III extradiol ring-cleavage dioxygenase [Nevskiales bacterium]